MKSINVFIILLIFVLTGMISCNNKQTMDELNKYQQKEVIEAQNIELVKQTIHFLDIEDYGSMRKNNSEDFKVFIGSSDKPISFDEGIPLFKMLHYAFPDYSHHIENIFASGDYVAVQFLFSAVHKNQFQNIPPTNKKIEYKGIQIYRIRNNKIETIHAIEDNLTLMNQLGLELK
ncbi:MAG: ester cyclase [Bacteroidales bacterium]|nr:ester cyclase [Bacteroidales bacterium]